MGDLIPMTKADFTSIIGEGLHTGLRKGTDAPEAHDLWEAISRSEKAWGDALDFLVQGLETMGFSFLKRNEINDAGC